MKKIFFFLMLLAGLATMTVSAQQTLTVADGTGTSEYVPVYGFYEDAFLLSQTIYPASLLTSMVGETIQSMTFYLSSSATLTSTFAVKLGTTTDASFATSSFLTSPSTTVYTGTFAITNNQITLNFNTPFLYTGGNLLLEVSTISTTGDDYDHTYFYGISSIGSSVSGYSYTSSSSISSATDRDFIPKTTFSYGTISCYMPSDFSVVASDMNSIILNWRDVNNTGATYTIYDMSDTSVVASGITDTTYEVMGLTAATNYTFGIVADCGGGDMSNMVTVQAQTSACALTDQCSYTIVKNDSYGDGWNGGELNVYSNGTLFATLGLTTGYTATETIIVCDNATLTFSWVAGNYPDEVSFNIYDVNGILVHSVADASTLSGGTFFTTVANCTPAACMPVTALSVDSINTTSVFLSWSDANNTGASYTIYDMSDTSVVISGLSSTTYEVANLTAGQQYVFAVEADCGSDLSVPMTISATPGVYNIADFNSLTVCSGLLTDDGGLDGNYGSSRIDTIVLYPATSGSYIMVSGTMSTESNYDYLTIYDGVGTSGTQLFRQSGQNLTVPPTASATALTVVFTSDGGVNYAGFALNISCVTCMPVSNLTVDSTTTTSVFLSWNDANTGSSYTIYNMADNSVVASGVNATTYEVTNLSASTSYTFGVEANCGGGDDANVTTVTGRTECGMLTTLPYTCGFETGEFPASGSNVMPYCWSKYNDATSSSNYYPYVYNYNTYAHTGDRSLYFYTTSYSSYADTMMAVLPQVDATVYPMNGNQLSFWMRTSSSTDTFNVFVGTVSDPTDPSTFVIDNALTVTGITYNKYDVNLMNAPASNSYAAIMVTRSATYGSIYIDDVILREIPTCLSVTGLGDSNVTSYSADLFWTAGDAETEWEISINNVSEFVNTNPYTVSNLSPETNYTVMVRAICTAGDSSAWSQPISFTTLPTCPAPTNLTIANLSTTSAEITWTPGDQESEWEVLVGNVSESVYDTTHTLNNLTPETNYSVKVRAICGVGDTSAWSSTLSIFTGYCQPNPSSVDGSGITNVTFGTAPEVVNNSPANSGNITYGNYASQVGAVAAGTVAHVDITYATGFTYGTLIWVDWNNNLTFDDNEIVFTGTSLGSNPTTLNASFAVPATQDTGLYRMRIGGADSYFDNYINGSTTAAHDPCASSSWMVFHDYTLHVTEAPNCLPVTNLTVSAATDNSLTLTWSDAINNGTYTIYNMADTSLVTSNEIDTTYTVTGLTANTQYTFGVVADCGGGDLSGMVTVSGQTECSVFPIPFTEGFENGIGCWTLVNCHSSTGVNSSAAITGTYGFEFYYTTNPPQYLISPQFAAATTPLQLEFDYANNSTYYSETFKVGYSTTTSDVNAFTWGQELTASNQTMQHYSELIPAGAKYVAIQCTSNDQYYLFIDNVSIATPPTCLPVTGLAVGTVTSNSVTLNWTDALNTGATYTVYDMGTNTAIAQNITATTYTVTGLTASTSYTFGVEVDCGGGDHSTIAQVTVSTECDAVASFPYTEGFENGLGCWEIVDNDGDGIPWFLTTGSTSLTPHTGSYMVASLSYYDGSVLYPDNYLISPKFTLPASSTITLSWYFMVDASYPGDKYSVYVSTGNTVSDFTTPLFTIVPTSTHGTWTQQTLDLSAYAGQQVYVAFRHYDCSDEDVILLDDISITVNGGSTPTDSCVAPTGLTATNATAHSVLLNWTENGNATSWTVNYKEANAAQWSTTTASAHPYTLTGLQPATEYSVYVVANCGNDVSEPSNTVMFTTAVEDGIADYEQTISLYPNPNNGQFTINNEQLIINSVQVYDVYGKLLKSVEVNSNTAVIDAHELSAGMYFVRVSTEKGVVTKSFVKK